MDPFRGADKKLGELMLRGWTMLADSCTVSNCRCPLMRSPDGQKYCVNCETWIYPNKNPEPKKFGELFSTKSQIKKEKKIVEEEKKEDKKIEKKENKKIEKKEDKKIEKKEEKKDIKISGEESVEVLMENKLKFLGRQLNEEDDIKKCEDIIALMNKILDFLERIKKIH